MWSCRHRRMKGEEDASGRDVLVDDHALPLAESGQTLLQWLACGMDVFAPGICATCCHSNCGTGSSCSTDYVIVECGN